MIPPFFFLQDFIKKEEGLKEKGKRKDSKKRERGRIKRKKRRG